MNRSRDQPGGARAAPLVQDETLTELTLLDVLDLDLDGDVHLNGAFLEEVEREARAEASHRAALGYQSDRTAVPALRGALRARARALGHGDVDVERLVHTLRRMFPHAWES